MKTLASAAVLVLVMGCTTTPTEQSQSWAASDEAFQKQRRDADARARKAGDERPYPTGWVGLPRKRDPRITAAIRLGQTTTEVAGIMGREGWSHSMTRLEFLDRLRATYQQYSSSHSLPKNLNGIEEQLPAQGKFIQWQYQGFSSTADWIVVFFASPTGQPDSEPRVVARGVFGLGCF